MGFTLRTVRDGQIKQFSLKEILSFIGDQINDEILIDGESYRISSCIELGGSGSSGYIIWNSISIPISQNNQVIFQIPDDIIDANSVFLIINNVLYNQGLSKDFHMEGQSLFWHGGFSLELSDSIIIKYSKSII